MAEPIDAAAIIAELGDNYKDTKALEGVTDSTMLAKRFIDTQSKIGEKLENVIQKPPANATEIQKAQFESDLKKELGAPDSVEAYSSEPVEGVARSSELDIFLKQAFLDEGISVSTYSRLVNKLDLFQQNAQNQVIEAENQKFTEEFEKYKSAHTGDKLITGTRTALKAILQYAGDEQKDLTDAIKSSKILDNPGDMDALKKLKIWPSILAHWERIGDAMKSDKAITNEGIPSGTETGAPADGTVEKVIASIYTHPSSVKDREARGKKY